MGFRFFSPVLEHRLVETGATLGLNMGFGLNSEVSYAALNQHPVNLIIPRRVVFGLRGVSCEEFRGPKMVFGSVRGVGVVGVVLAFRASASLSDQMHV